MDEEVKSKIEGLDEKLYSKTRYRAPLDIRKPVKELELPEIEEKWQTPALDELLKHERIIPTVHPLMKKIFVLAIIFFVVAVGVAGFVFLGGANFVSSKNVDISVLGPATIRAGEVLELGAIVSNTNNADLELANLSVQYPLGTKDPDDTTHPLTYTKDELGILGAGAETVHNIRAVLLGATGEVKEIKFSVEYKVKGSNATFYKEKIFEIAIGDAPIVLTVKSPSFTTSGETFATTVTITSNSTDVLKNVVLKAEYPHGYAVVEASPGAIADSNVWMLGDLVPKSVKTVTIHGQIVGEDKEERTFRFYVGVSDGGNASPDLGVVIASLSNTISIIRPSIGLAVLFNGENSSVYIAPDARTIATSIEFRNNLSEKIYNPRLEVALSDPSLDKSSVTVGNDGVYDSVNSKVVWNLINLSGLPELAPGEGGKVTLRFASLPSTSLSQSNHDIRLVLSLTAVQVGATGQLPLAVSETRLVKISSQVNFSAKVLRTLGSFANRGPIPPKVKEETTYTVVFSVGNTQGDLAEAKVSAKLGRGVKWLGGSSFASGGLSYDAPSNTVTWNLGTLTSGTGFSSATLGQSFQVALTPFTDQIGLTPVLLTDVVFSGRDTVSGDVVAASNPPLTTRLVSDPAFIQGDDVVQK